LTTDDLTVDDKNFLDDLLVLNQELFIIDRQPGPVTASLHEILGLEEREKKILPRILLEWLKSPLLAEQKLS